MKLPLWHDRPEDRLATTVFVAALLHGVFILGVRFTAPNHDRDPLPTLEVLLVPDGPNESPNPDASYLAQRNQHGSGTSQSRQRTSLPESSSELTPSEGAADGEHSSADEASEMAGGEPTLAARTVNAQRAVAGTWTQQPDQFHALPQETQLPQIGVDSSAAADRTLRLRGKASANDRLFADTRESAIAGYLDGWKRRIERVGTLNFPDEARRRSLSGNPVIEVAIRSDGRLQEVLVRRSSGHRELDNAALGIVRLASPFDPFPSAMRERYPVLRFAYEWQFLNGRLASGAVFSNGR